MHRELHLTDTPWGYACLAIFALAYVVIVLEERLHLRKSVPALVAASGVWILVALLFTLHGDAEVAATAFRHTLLDYAELMLFLLAAMTFVNTLEERLVFAALRARLAGRGYSLRRIFWITGALAFVISPLADNLTTALIMGAVSLAVGRDRPKFVVVAEKPAVDRQRVNSYAHGWTMPRSAGRSVRRRRSGPLTAGDRRWSASPRSARCGRRLRCGRA